MRYFYVTEMLYNEKEMELAINDFMVRYDCSYEQAKSAVKIEDYWSDSPYYQNRRKRSENEYKTWNNERFDSICIYDIQDRNGWQSADYYFKENTLYFSGCWHKVPPMLTELVPTQEEAIAWGVKHKDLWEC